MRSLTALGVGIIGVGEIASAMVEGLCTDPRGAPEVWLSPRGEASSGALAARFPSVRVCADNQEVADKASVLLITVRPDHLDEALVDVRVPAGSVVVSAVAGVAHDELHRLLGPDVTIVRSIPLPAVRRRESVTAVYPAHPVATELFDRLGGTLEVPDGDAFAALSAATGTISAYLRFLALIADWTGRHGVEPTEADRYVRSIFADLSRGLDDTSRSLGQLTTDHETPGGLNEQLRLTWLDADNAAALDAALDGLLQRVRRSA
jgi:pyrroline-5-carboxylate reductase